MEVEKVAQDRYRLASHGHVMTVSAQDLRDISDWCLLHMRELEAEAAEPPSYDDIHKVEAYRREYEQQLAERGDKDIQASAWRAIEAQAKIDLEAIVTDQDAYAFMDRYLSRELRHQYVKIYQSDRHEMNRTPRAAVKNLLSLPPL